MSAHARWRDPSSATRLGLCIAAAVAAASLASGETRRYDVRDRDSRLGVHVGRAGLLKLFGHDHWIEARSFTGWVHWSEEEAQSSEFHLEIDAGSLDVADEASSDDDRREVQSTMESRALGLPESRVIRFDSTEVRIDERDDGSYRLRVTGTLALRGVEARVEVPLALELAGGRLVARGSVEIDGRDWGVPQIAAAGGSVKTKNELRIDFELVAIAPVP